jgi:hypothetical protein
MAYYYSTPERETGKGAPDVETFHIPKPSVVGVCKAGWYWRPVCGSGRTPRHYGGVAVGPFATEADALADARLADWED